MSSEIIPYADVEKMGSVIAKSGLFGIKTPEQAIALMLIAQSENLHPARAAAEYHIIQGRPSLKSDAMLARFQAAGGSVKWMDMTDNRVSAVFSHPQGGSLEIDWDMARAKKADLGGKDMWKKYPRQMLRARVISEGIRTVFPGCVSGFYTPEEVQDFDDKPATVRSVAPKDITPPKAEQAQIGSSPDAVDIVEVKADDVFTGPGIADVRKAYSEAVARIGADQAMKIIRSVAGESIKSAKDIPPANYSGVIDALITADKEAA